MWIALVYFVILVVAFALFIVVPQRRNSRARQAMLASLEVGDAVLTTGGIHAVIVELDADDAHLQVAPGVVISVVRNAIGARVEAAGTPDPTGAGS